MMAPILYAALPGAVEYGMSTSFLPEPAPTPEGQALIDADQTDNGYVMNLTRLWTYQPRAKRALLELLAGVSDEVGFSMRERAIMVAAAASTIGDSYCSLAWGGRLSKASDEQVAAAVLAGSDEGLTEAERAMATWARIVASDANSTSVEDLQALRDAGWDDRQIFAMTTWVALRIAFSTVNDALGAAPDAELRELLPPSVLDTVTWGRPIQGN
jgi:alkylhydroperoxidase family enzyme